MSHTKRGAKDRTEELWGGRPMDGYAPTSKNKRLCRKIERARGRQQTRREASAFDCTQEPEDR